MRNGFLPICRKDMEERGWEQLDLSMFPEMLTWIIRLWACDHHTPFGGEWI